MQKKGDMIFASLLILLGIAVINGSVRLKLGTPLHPLSGFFPFLAGFLLIGLSLILFIRGWLGRGQGHQPLGELRRMIIMVACLGGYVAVLEPLGYVFSTIIVTAAVLAFVHFREASLEAAKLRLRPILMTSFAFILGCVPLAKASGAGALSRQVMGFAVIGGMCAASFIAIFLIPAGFYVIEKLSGKKHEAPKPATAAAPEAAH